MELKDYEKTITRLANYYNSRKLVENYSADDYAQDFRMVFLKCDANFDAKRNVKFETFFINSCKNYIISIKRKHDKEVKAMLSMDNQVYDFENTKFVETISDNSYFKFFTDSIIVDYLLSLKGGNITYDFVVDEYTLKDLAVKYGKSMSTIDRTIKRNLKDLKDFIESLRIISSG